MTVEIVVRGKKTNYSPEIVGKNSSVQVSILSTEFVDGFTLYRNGKIELMHPNTTYDD